MYITLATAINLVNTAKNPTLQMESSYNYDIFVYVTTILKFRN